MVLVHRHRAVTPLPEMPGAPLPRVNDAGVTPMRARQRAAQPVLVVGTEDEMRVIGHQTPRPHRDPRLLGRRGEKIAIAGVVLVRKEHPLPAVAALGDVVGQARRDEASETGHALLIAGGPG